MNVERIDRGVIARRSFAASLAGHIAVIVLLLSPAMISAPPKLDVSNAIEVVLAPPLSPPAPPQAEPQPPQPQIAEQSPQPEPQPPQPQPEPQPAQPQVAEQPPQPEPPPPQVVEQPKPLPAPVAEAAPPLSSSKPEPESEPRPSAKSHPRPRRAQQAQQPMPQQPSPLPSPAPQVASIPPAVQQAPQSTTQLPAPAPSQAPRVASIPPPAPAPRISPNYGALLSSWLESHKRYPEGARQRGEQGRAVLRFRVDRYGRVLDYAVVSSTGFADLDGAVENMMRGAVLPPFPPGMTEPEIEVSVPIRFDLSRGA